MLGNSREAIVEQRSDEVYNRFPGEEHRRIGGPQRMWRHTEVWEKSPADEEGKKSAPLHSFGFLLHSGSNSNLSHSTPASQRKNFASLSHSSPLLSRSLLCRGNKSSLCALSLFPSLPLTLADNAAWSCQLGGVVDSTAVSAEKRIKREHYVP
ncbi:hypothetical protein QQF64_015368 [Cirrhinus molitorella]|uniref:Uncharacterized protein n=1 Tax=Cirrhinus molitorella TaxID=172907 RepID=A0ABR3NUS6_9TELE